MFAAPAGAVTFGYFKSPSANIVCVHSQAFVLCGIKSGLKPRPPYTPACKASGLDYNADRVSLGATGRAHPIACSGDAGPFVGKATQGCSATARRGAAMVCAAHRRSRG
jgi:hypothetical protein